jgi:hypothetical protein
MLMKRASERHPGAYLAWSAVSYRVRDTLYVLTRCAVVITVTSAILLWVLTATNAPTAVARLTPTNGVGEHGYLATAVTDPQLLFMVLIAGILSALLIAAGGLQRVTR